MKIVYIPMDKHIKGIKKRILITLRSFFYFQNPGSFFEAGLKSAFDVTSKNINELISNSSNINNTFDAIVVNSKLECNKWKNIDTALIDIAKIITIPKILFIRTDRTIDMPNNSVLDNYDIIFKQEPFKNLDKYPISTKNKNKIYPAMVNSTMHKIVKNKLFNIIYNQKKLFNNQGGKYKYDVFFLGRINQQNTIREDAWARIVKENFNRYGGIQARDGCSINNKKLIGKKIKLKKYITKMKESKISLALDGIGTFTPRHLDIWKLGCFMLASPTIRDIQLPFEIKEGVHYIAFDNLDDMVRKIKYYLNHENERIKIAEAGKKLFDLEYNIKKHGKYIKNIIIQNINEKSYYNNK